MCGSSDIYPVASSSVNIQFETTGTQWIYKQINTLLHQCSAISQDVGNTVTGKRYFHVVCCETYTVPIQAL
ncbi:hypothetical protein RRG08_064214 [Elysia crispata]|uniref:Uncharacterized protein n=1 Tax=Elysia crispata TaxID=231223 RepID=A0AAE0YEJ0_9GAST|nr:hypothetical protein RRG08_064214 [Elysia crispata]